jgi:hypothetical protein
MVQADRSRQANVLVVHVRRHDAPARVAIHALRVCVVHRLDHYADICIRRSGGNVADVGATHGLCWGWWQRWWRRCDTRATDPPLRIVRGLLTGPAPAASANCNGLFRELPHGTRLIVAAGDSASPSSLGAGVGRQSRTLDLAHVAGKLSRPVAVRRSWKRLRWCTTAAHPGGVVAARASLNRLVPNPTSRASRVAAWCRPLPDAAVWVVAARLRAVSSRARTR